ncbi:hypothetical protein [Aminobacter sp. LjRoot7]|uniref:hypothetical protein n=1 Tax=Aminobacter sp. LjRoot7 TaxID=3342335 RepID=UPI003F503CEA
MALERTSAVLDMIERTVQSRDDMGAVSNFLAQYAAVVLYSEMEERVSEIVKKRLGMYSHPIMVSFVTSTMDDLIRRTPKSDISKLTARFGEVFRDTFNEFVEDRIVTTYSNIIAARHDAGHKRGSNITITDVRHGQRAADHILDALNKCFDQHCN